MCPVKKNERFENQEKRRHCSNSYSPLPSGSHTSTKTSIFGSSVIHSEKLKGEEALNPPVKKEWVLNLGTLSDIEL